MKKYISFVWLLCPFFALSQNYDVSLIPDSLKRNADVVKRSETYKVSIVSPSKAKVKRTYALTILNEAGQQHAAFISSYSKSSTIEEITGTLYDAAGKKLKVVKKKDISDVSYDDEMSLMTDSRLKRHSFFFSQFPYTIEYEEENELLGLFFLPHWQPVEDERFAVQQSKFVVEYPADYAIRYKNFLTAEPLAGTAPKSKLLTWEITNQVAVKEELYQPPFNEVTPNVYIAPTDFEVGGYKGNMNSWLSLGAFVKQLNNGRDQLPEKTKQDIRTLVSDLTSQEEKIKVLYEYLQKNTRYISIQIGIGSWQPFDATYVANRRYGDCKALSNYMVSILKEAGIKANYVLVNSGEGRRGLWEDFSAPYFNHAIMCIPNAKDTMWLECTSQTKSYGYMGSSTGNRKALLIGDDGGHVVSTPTYLVNDNLQKRNVNAVIDADGNLSAEVFTYFSGEQQELQHSIIHETNVEQRERYLNNALNLPTYKIEQSSYKETKGKVPTVDEFIKVTAPNYASITGKRIFIQPNLFNKMGSKLNTDVPRKFDIKFDYAYRDIDSINIIMPIGYTPEAIPKNISLTNKFGSYSINFKVENNIITLTRISERNSGRFPAADFILLAKFFEDIYKADRSRIVFVKKEA
jgi:hypothetical protein